MSTLPHLLSVNVGMPADVAWQGRTVHTGIFKYPVDGPVKARRLNLEGDGQGDRNGHGGEIRAVLVYQRESYDFWRRTLSRDDLEYGQFGENFTVDGLADDEVHIGDRFRIGAAEFEVTQPRVTCFRVGMRLGVPDMPALLVARHRPGFYLRVLTEGSVQAGDEIVRTGLGRHRMTVAAIDALLYLPDRDTDQLRAAADIPALSPGWRDSFRDLLDPAPAVPEVSSGWPGFRPLRVSRVVPESPAVLSIYLTTPDDSPLPSPEPGQYLTVRPSGAGVRSYSLSGPPSEREWRISVKRELSGAVSPVMHALTTGNVLEVAAPRGDFVLTAGEEPVVLLSAGIGVTPVLAMLHALAAAGSPREIWWVHTSRSPAFLAEVGQLLTGLDRVHSHYTNPGVDGRLSAEILAELNLPVTASAYVCGPDEFMAAMRTALVRIGLSADHVHSELFGARPAINPGVTETEHPAPHPPPGPVGTGPAVTFTRSGLTVPWSDEHRTLLEFAEACDVPTQWSCRSGVCHLCQTPVLAGTVDYQPDPLEPPAQGTALICCSQPKTDLILDI
jgi:ferredoxin-NADP reductase/MOSC domain-containing protein YiiM